MNHSKQTRLAAAPPAAKPAPEGGDGAGIDINALAEHLGVTVDPATDPAGFVKELLAKLDEVRAELTGEAPATQPADDGSDAEPPTKPVAASRALKMTAREHAMCEAKGIDKGKYLRVKAEMAGRTTWAGRAQ